MKPTVINDTTFRLCSVTVEGIEEGSRAIDPIVLSDASKEWLMADDKIMWLENNTPGWNYRFDHQRTDLRYHFELVLSFERPEDACAFKLRWL